MADSSGSYRRPWLVLIIKDAPASFDPVTATLTHRLYDSTNPTTNLRWHAVDGGGQPPDDSGDAAIGKEMEMEEGGSNPPSTAAAAAAKRRRLLSSSAAPSSAASAQRRLWVRTRQRWRLPASP
ncbi:unnamed protein product [Lactuca virosa]|uniref:Uncharacterized protein n=1 Tax=Lactuca virosa TaxID=75947 RepID=A0AAU9MH93_9ASTR|nr:unnamed protein product [Lactuca virosa]